MKRKAHRCAKPVMNKCKGVKGRKNRSVCLKKAWRVCKRKK